MIQPEQTEEKKASVRKKMPRLGKVSQWALLIGVFLILFVPGRLMYQRQLVKQAELSQQLSNMETLLSVSSNEREELQAQIKQAEAELLAASETFPGVEQNVDITENLLELAESNDITINNINTDLVEDEDGDYPDFAVFTINIELEGQVPQFQNFLLDLDTRFKTTKIETVAFTIAADPTAEDKAFIKINVFCDKGS